MHNLDLEKKRQHSLLSLLRAVAYRRETLIYRQGI